MPAYYVATVEEFLATSNVEVLGRLLSKYSRDGFASLRTDAEAAWEDALNVLHRSFGQAVRERPAAKGWTLLLEFVIPRMQQRIDAVLLGQFEIAVIECKQGDVGRPAMEQVEDYALNLHYFHKPSRNRRIVPVLLSTRDVTRTLVHRGNQYELYGPNSVIAPVQVANAHTFCGFLETFDTCDHGETIEVEEWNLGQYRPVPSIIEAALGLAQNISVTEMAHAEAAQHDIDELVDFLLSRIQQAQANRDKLICFLTGVPGSGKTLVGLSLAFHKRNTGDRIPAMHFMSGNGPLVKVLQAALSREERRRSKKRKADAEREAKTLIQNVHYFAREYYEPSEDGVSRIPYDRVVLFDEAQRAWDREQNLRKFKRDISEPAMLLSIMERLDWAVVVALVGGGQEIDDGEAGLSEWGKSLQESTAPWQIIASPEALHGGTSVAGSSLFASNKPLPHVVCEPKLHLKVSVRSLRAERLAEWVNALLDGESEKAQQALPSATDYPILLTREFRTAKLFLQQQRGSARSGLIGSSAAARLRADGLEPSSAFHGDYPWEEWFLAGRGDLRSSYQAEVFATEFEIQGLEIDWSCLCWGGDFLWHPEQNRWQERRLFVSRSRWAPIKSERKRMYRRNAYRVLLTRARKGMIVYVPRGEAEDPTRVPEEFNQTAAFLEECGVQPI